MRNPNKKIFHQLSCLSCCCVSCSYILTKAIIYLLNMMMSVDMSRGPLSGKSTVFGLSRFTCLVLTEVLLLVSMTCQTGSVFFQDWREGAGDTFMFPPNVTLGFSTRLYGLIYVEGLRQMTWAELSTNTCDRWGMYINTKPLFPTAPACMSNTVDPATCTSDFENHLRLRCSNYSAITLLNWITIGLLSLTSLLTAMTAILMLLVPLGNWKRYILAALFAASIIAFPMLIAWGSLTYYFFKQLSDSATYPFPTIGLGGWIALAGVVTLVLATLIFWRLTKGLRISTDGKTDGKISTSNSGILDMAEHKYLVKGKIADDTDEEEG